MPARGALLSDYTGQRFGRLTVVRMVGRVNRVAQWECLCDCGNITVATSGNLKAKTRSCGCLRKEVTSQSWTRHGHAKVLEGRTPEYQSWTSMLARVRATTGRRFQDYGSRGITVCDRWLSFENFLADMGPRPDGTSIDRIDNDGNYEPGNCRWATDSQQVSNRRFLGRRKRTAMTAE
jgi:hypothetical protein